MADSIQIVIAATAEYYRRVARDRARGMGTVLEIGCSTGVTTRILAGRCEHVVAVDVSHEFLERARKSLEGSGNVTFARVDGRDVGALSALISGTLDAIFIDVGGDAMLENVVATADLCLRYFRPEQLMVIRSKDLAAFTSLITGTEPRPPHAARRPCGRRAALESLLELSHSSHAPHRLFAARRLRSIRSPEARRRLEELASDPHPQVRRIATNGNNPSSPRDGERPGGEDEDGDGAGTCPSPADDHGPPSEAVRQMPRTAVIRP